MTQTDATLDDVRLMDFPDSTEEIPTLDIADYLAGKPGEREALAAELRRVTETVGFFYLKGHDVPQAVIDRAFAESKRFHALPIEAKMKIPNVNNGVLRTGYQPSKFGHRPKANVNIIAGAKPNLYSFLNVNRDQPKAELYQQANVWPDLPGFRDGVMDYHARLEALGHKFLPLWAVSLGVKPDYFAPFFTDPQLSVALIHYPPQPEIGSREYGIAPHCDSPFMTFLAQIGQPALAVRMPSGHWRLVDVIPGTLLVNTGHTIARWTNDRYLSTKHRVLNTSGLERYSIAAFFGPNAEARLECLPTCQSPDNPPRYPPMTYAELRRWYQGY